MESTGAGLQPPLTREVSLVAASIFLDVLNVFPVFLTMFGGNDRKEIPYGPVLES